MPLSYAAHGMTGLLKTLPNESAQSHRQENGKDVS